MKSIYVYYRIDPARETTAAARIDALLVAMAAHCSRRPRRLSGCEDPAVWMEVFEGVTDFSAFVTALKAAALSFDCAAFTRGERHLECFSQPGRAPYPPANPGRAD